MNREFQDYTRAELAERIAEVEIEVEQLKRFVADQEAQEQAVYARYGVDPNDVAGPSLPLEGLKEVMPFAPRMSEALQLQQGLFRTIQAINAELHIRDDPQLSAQLGPGRD